MSAHHVLRRSAVTAVAVAGLALGAAGCGGDDDAPPADDAAGSSTSAAPADSTTTVPGYPTWTAGSMAQSGRLSCMGGIETFEVTGAPIGETLATYETADAAVAAEIERHPDAVTAVVMPTPEERGTRYVLDDAEGVSVEEVVVGETPEGLRIVLRDTCG